MNSESGVRNLLRATLRHDRSNLRNFSAVDALMFHQIGAAYVSIERIRSKYNITLALASMNLLRNSL